MTHDEMIAVIQAHKEGKTIQYMPLLEFRLDSQGWKDRGKGKNDFNFGYYLYRVKPEPIVRYTVVNKFGAGEEQYHRTQDQAYSDLVYKTNNGAFGPYRIVKLVEEM